MEGNINFNAVNGLIEYKDGLFPVSLTFSEWWNGEGLDIQFHEPESGSILSFHSEQLRALFVAAAASGHVCVEEIKKEADKITESYMKIRRATKPW